jgi:hypothetical protein
MLKTIALQLLILAFFCDAASAASADSRKKQYWQIEYSTSFVGIVKLKFDDRFLLMKLEKFGLTALSTAPKWNSIVYNEANRRYLKLSNEQWKNSKFLQGLLRHRKTAAAPKSQLEYTHKKRG